MAIYVEFLCGECGAELSAAASRIGETIECASCQTQLTVPNPVPSSMSAHAEETSDLNAIASAWDDSASRIVLSTCGDIPGRTVDAVLELVEGSAVMSRHAGHDLAAGLKSIIGGEIASYTDLLQDARRVARQRMISRAASLGANAILSVRYTTAAISPGMSEILAYGTAVSLCDA